MDSKNRDSEESNDEEMAETDSPQKLVNPTVTIDQIKKITGIVVLRGDYYKVILHLMEQRKLVKMRDDEFDEMSSTGAIAMAMGPQLPFDDLRPEDRLEFSDLASAPNSVLFGKYLLCKTISFATEGLAVITIITDPKGDLAIPLNLHNYSFSDDSEIDLDPDDILPPGSFLVVKNPCFKRLPSGELIMISKNPAEVELVSRKRIQDKFPDLGWEGEIGEKTLKFSKKRCFWSEIEGDEAAFEKLKGLGDKGLVDKRFTDAIRFYDMALDYCAGNEDGKAIIHSNKSAALLGLGCFHAALKCADLALEVDPGNEKHNYYKTKALIGLGKYEEGRRFFYKAFNQFPSLQESEDCKTLLDNVLDLSWRKNCGPTKSQLLSIYKETFVDGDAIPEFKGPLAQASEIEGKGRGLIATEDIVPGQLLLCTRAFVYQATELTEATPIIQDKILGEQVVRKIANMLLFDPELRPVFYNLSAGPELGHLEPGDPKIDYIDMDRIAEIRKINTFDSAEETSKTDKETGLWMLPSLLNHSCSENNCVWRMSREWLILTAISEIKKGEELTIAYISPIANNYDKRQAFFQKIQGFSCNCKLCQLDASECISVKNEREEILQSLDQLTLKCCPGEIRKALEAVKRLVSLRKDNVSLNFPLLFPQVGRILEILFLKGCYRDCISLLKPMFDVANASAAWHHEGISMAFNLFTCYVVKKNKSMTKVWAGIVKRLLMKFYGHLELVEVEDSLVELLKIKFGNDFFQEDNDD